MNQESSQQQHVPLPEVLWDTSTERCAAAPSPQRGANSKGWRLQLAWEYWKQFHC